MSEMWKHQVDSVNMFFEQGAKEIALFHEQGTGKTRTIIEIMRRTFAMHGRVLNTLIICPLL